MCKKILFTVANNPGAVYYAKEFRKAGYEIHMGDMDSSAIGKFFSDYFYQLPSQASDEYIEYLLGVVENNKIDVLVPAGELECLKVAQNMDRFKKLGCCAVTVNEETLVTAIDKAHFYDYIAKNTSLPMMKYHTIECINDLKEGLKKLDGLKLSVKPAVGSGSRGFTILTDENINAREFFASKNPFANISIKDFYNMLEKSNDIPRLILMEYLDGIHYDTNMICERGNVLFQSIRTRERSINGTITRATIVEEQEIYEINRTIAKALNITGYVCTQYIGNKIIELNPRWSTSLNNSAINEYLMSVDLALGNVIKLPSELDKADYLGTKFIRYFDVLVYKPND